MGLRLELHCGVFLACRLPLMPVNLGRPAPVSACSLVPPLVAKYRAPAAEQWAPEARARLRRD